MGTPQNFPSFETYSNNYNQQYYPQPRPEQARPKPPSRGYAAHNTQKITQQTRPKIVPKRYVDRYTVDNSYANIEQQNSILGSGNFEILKGGTFYDKDDYLRPYSNNKPPRQNNYYGDNDIFSNFRDFADIKGDAKGTITMDTMKDITTDKWRQTGSAAILNFIDETE